MAENVKAGRNGFDPDKAASLVQRIENLNKDIESSKSQHMARCKTIRGDINMVLEEGKDAGIPKGVLKAKVKERELERKMEACREDLEGDDQDTFDNLTQALGQLGDTPLGEAAQAAA